MKYQIELNEKQLDIIADAVEQYSRMNAGQIELTFLTSLRYKIDLDDNGLRKRDEVENLLLQIKNILFPGLGLHGNYHTRLSDRAYDIYKSILTYKEIEKQENEGQNYIPNVHAPPQLQMSDQPLPKIKRIDVSKEIKK